MQRPDTSPAFTFWSNIIKRMNATNEKMRYLQKPNWDHIRSVWYNLPPHSGRFHCFQRCNPPSLTHNPPHPPSRLCGLQPHLLVGDLRLFRSIEPWIGPTRLTRASQVQRAAARRNGWLYSPSSSTRAHTYKPVNEKRAWNWKHSSNNTHLSCQ